MMAATDNPWGEEPAWVKSNDDAVGAELDGDDRGEDLSYFGAQHVVVLIDCHPSMFVPCIEWEGDTISAMDYALIACEHLCRNRVLHVATSKTGKRDGVGVFLYGTRGGRLQEEEENAHSDEEDGDSDGEDAASPHMIQLTTKCLVALAPPGIQQIRGLRACLYDEVRGRQRDLEKEFGSGKANSDDVGAHLRNALHEASKTFVNAKCVKKRTASDKAPPDAKTVWIFTNNDNPHSSNREERGLMILTSNDTKENGLDLQLWPLQKVDSSPFDTALLYDDFCTTPDQLRAHMDMEELMEVIRQQAKTIRRAFSLPLLFPDWREQQDPTGIMLDFFRPIQQQKKPLPVWINPDTKKPTEKVTQALVKDTGEFIATTSKRAAGEETASQTQPKPTAEIRQFAVFASERIPMTKEEVLAIKQASNANAEQASIILLGFKPIDSIPMTHILESTYFVYPNDEKVVGSVEAFAGLHAAMMRNKVIAVGELLTRVNTTSRLVALYPQAEFARPDDGYQIAPPGMNVVVLPYEDDVRAMEVDAGDTASEEAVEKAMDLVRNQKLVDVELGQSFVNGALNEFWRYIESVALETPMPPKEEYDTELNEEDILEAAGQQIEGFRDALCEDVKEEKKRASKKRKASEPIEDDTGIDWVDLFNNDELAGCKVDQLKKYLRSIGARVSGRKEELLLRVRQSIEDRMAKGELK